MLRKAKLSDVPRIEQLMRDSLNGLGRQNYDERQIASAVVSVARLDVQMVTDGTYFVAEEDGALVACGGWSRRAKLYAGSAAAGDETRLLDPRTEPARIRAMFVHPQWSRRGLGRAILDASEREARSAGFRRLELMALLSGERLYVDCGYVRVRSTELVLEDGTIIGGTLMEKELGA